MVGCVACLSWYRASVPCRVTLTNHPASCMRPGACPKPRRAARLNPRLSPSSSLVLLPPPPRRPFLAHQAPQWWRSAARLRVRVWPCLRSATTTATFRWGMPTAKCQLPTVKCQCNCQLSTAKCQMPNAKCQMLILKLKAVHSKEHVSCTKAKAWLPSSGVMLTLNTSHAGCRL